MNDLRARATQRLEQALRDSGVADPRPRLRDMLRELRDRDAEAFKTATLHFEERLIPAVAGDSGDAIGEWLEFGRVLATLTAEGDTVLIDPTGLSSPYSRPVPLDRLVLHLPKSQRSAAVPVALPAELSPAQQASYALLVEEAVRHP